MRLQLVHDLHGGERLAGADRHEQEQALFMAGHRHEHTMHGHGLVPARRYNIAGRGALVAVELLLHQVCAVVVQFVLRRVPRPKVGRGLERVDEPFGARNHVALDDLDAVGGVGDRLVELLGVANGLLKTIGGATVGARLASTTATGRPGTTSRT